MKLAYKTRPWPHQVRCLKFVVRQRGGLVQVPMRWGKSWVGINWAASMYYLEDVRRVVVITVTSGLGVWQGQIEQHCPVPYMVIDHHGELLSKSAPGEDAHLRFLLVNYPNVYSRAYTGEGREWVVVPNSTLQKFHGQAIIADESHHLGNPTSEQCKNACQLARRMKMRLLLTGTMFHRKPFFVFGQMKFYDDGRTFGTSFTNFKDQIAIFRDPQKYVLARYRNLKWMMDQVRPKAYIETKVPKRPTVRNLLHFHLTGENLRAYVDMEVDRVLKVGDETLTADVILTKHLWLMMIAGGFIRTPSGKYVQLGDDKLRMAEDRMKSYLENDITKVVVACRFKAELAAMAKVAKKVGFAPILFHGGVPKGEERHRRTRIFQKTKKPAAFISQISAGKESIDLSAADTILWYSLTQSYVDFDQFGDRIKKYGEKRTLMHDFLLARGSHDELALAAMDMKQDVARYLVTHPERAEELVAAHARRR